MWIKKNKDFIKYFMRLALPVMLQQLLVNLLQIADTVMISPLGENVISGVSVANKFFFIYNLLLFGLSNGIGLFFTQYYGAKNKEKYNQTFRFGLLACFIVAIMFTIFLFIVPELTIDIFVTSESIREYGYMYLNYIRLSYVPFAISMMCNVAYRSKGQTFITLQIGTISFIINVVLNYLLIGGHFGLPALGVEGAAIATLIARSVEMIISLGFINFGDSDLKLSQKYPLLDLGNVKEMVIRSLPLVGNEILWSVSLNIVFMNYCLIGESYIPALTVVDNVISLIYVAYAGCATVTGIVIGKSLGANNFEQAKSDAKKMIRIGTFINLTGSVLVALISPLIPGLFSLSGEIASMTIKLLIIKCLINWSQGFAETVYYILRAGGDTKGVFIIDGLFTCFGPLLISTVCARLFHLDLLYTYALSEGIYYLKIIISYYYYKKERWLLSLTKEGGTA